MRTAQSWPAVRGSTLTVAPGGAEASADHSRSAAASSSRARTIAGRRARWSTNPSSPQRSTLQPARDVDGEVLGVVGAAADRAAEAAAHARAVVGSARAQPAGERRAVQDARRRDAGPEVEPGARVDAHRLGVVRAHDELAARALGVGQRGVDAGACRCPGRLQVGEDGEQATGPRCPSRTSAMAIPMISARRPRPPRRRRGRSRRRCERVAPSGSAAVLVERRAAEGAADARRVAGGATSSGCKRADLARDRLPWRAHGRPEAEAVARAHEQAPLPAQGRAPDGQRVPDVPQPAPPAPRVPGVRHVRRP